MGTTQAVVARLESGKVLPRTLKRFAKATRTRLRTSFEPDHEALMERLTTTEAAVAAGVSVPQIHRIIDEKILPGDLYSTTQMRTFRTEASVLIAFYFETADLFGNTSGANPQVLSDP